MKNVPKLNDGKIYTVTRYSKEATIDCGDYRTFEEALDCARRYGAIIERVPAPTLSGVSFNTYRGSSIHIGVEFVDPLFRGKP